MLHRTLALLFVLVILAAPLAAQDGDEEPAVKEATSKELRHEQKIFKRDFDTVDIDFQLDALIRYSKCVHKSVADELIKLTYRNPDPYVRAEAAKGLRNQVLYPDHIGKKLLPLLKDDDLDPKILNQVLLTIGALNYRRAWAEIIDLISHDDDKVVVTVFKILGDWKELRACQEIQGFWDAYPTEGKWSTGSVTVDTGAAGTVDQRAAKRKWMAKYGNRAKQRARPDCVKALKIAVKKMTGEAIEKPAEFREWRSEHKKEIRAAKRQR